MSGERSTNPRASEMAASQEKIGDGLAEQGDFAGALKAYKASLAIKQKLADADPGNYRRWVDLAACQVMIGDLLVELADLPAALGAYEASLASMSRDPPARTEERPARSGLLAAVAAVFSGKRSTPRDAAIDQAKIRVKQAEHALEQSKTVLVATVQEKIGDALKAQGNLPAALEAYQTSLEMTERVGKPDPGTAEWYEHERSILRLQLAIERLRAALEP